MAGFFEPRGKVWNLDGVPRDFSFGTLPEDWDHIGPIFERSVHRVPALGECGIQLFLNGPEAFTPDGVYYLGEAPEVDGCFRGRRVQLGGHPVRRRRRLGPGRLDRRPPAAHGPVVGGHPPGVRIPGRPRLPGRTHPREPGAAVRHALALLPVPERPEAGGCRRCTTAWTRPGPCGARTAGWERPNWYAAEDQAREYVYSYGKQNWWANAGEECRAVRERVALFDQTSFAKFTVDGPRLAGGARPAEHGPHRRAGRPGRLHPVVQPQRRHRGRPDRHPTGPRPLPGSDRGRLPDPGLGPPAPRLPGPRRRDRRHHRALGHDRADGPQGPLRARPAHRRPAEQHRLPLRHLPAHRGGRHRRAGPAHELRGRAGLGAVPAQRARRGPVRRAGREGRAPRAGHGRLPRHEHAAAGVRLPALGPRHHRRGHPDRGRARLHHRLGQAPTPTSAGPRWRPSATSPATSA